MASNNSPSQRRRKAAFHRKSAVEFDFYKRRIGELCEQYPNIFNKRMPLPLAVGVHHQLVEDTEFSYEEISVLLKIWVRRWEYLCMAASLGRRFDLDGNETGWIAPEELKGFIKGTIRLRPAVLKIFCKRFLKETGRPALICVPIKERPELEMDHE